MPPPGWPGVLPRQPLWGPGIDENLSGNAGNPSADDRAWAAAHQGGYGLTENPSPWGYNRDEFMAEHDPGTYGFYDPWTGGYSSPTEVPFAVSGPNGPEMIGTGGRDWGDWSGGTTEPWTGGGPALPPSFDASMPGADQGYTPFSMDASMPGTMGDAGQQADYGPAPSMDQSMPGAAQAEPSFAEALSQYVDAMNQGDPSTQDSAGSWG